MLSKNELHQLGYFRRLPRLTVPGSSRSTMLPSHTVSRWSGLGENLGGYGIGLRERPGPYMVRSEPAPGCRPVARSAEVGVSWPAPSGRCSGRRPASRCKPRFPARALGSVVVGWSWWPPSAALPVRPWVDLLVDDDSGADARCRAWRKKTLVYATPRAPKRFPPGRRRWHRYRRARERRIPRSTSAARRVNCASRAHWAD